MGDDLSGAEGIASGVVGISPVFGVAPLITHHDVEVLGFEEVFVILCVGGEGKVVFVLLAVAAVAIVEVGGSPGGIVGELLAVGPVAAGIGMETQVFETVNLIVYLYVTHVVIGVGAVVLLIQT